MIRIRGGDYCGDGRDELWVSDASTGFTGFTLDYTKSYSSIAHSLRGTIHVADLDGDGDNDVIVHPVSMGTPSSIRMNTMGSQAELAFGSTQLAVHWTEFPGTGYDSQWGPLVRAGAELRAYSCELRRAQLCIGCCARQTVLPIFMLFLGRHCRFCGT